MQSLVKLLIIIIIIIQYFKQEVAAGSLLCEGFHYMPGERCER